MTNERQSEKTIEAHLVREARKRGGFALKLTSQFHRGMPDRLVLLPCHTLCFVELKSTGKKTTALQDKAIHQLKSMRFAVRVIDSVEEVDKLMADLDRRITQQKVEYEVFNSAKDEAMKGVKRKMAKYHEQKAAEKNDEV